MRRVIIIVTIAVFLIHSSCKDTDKKVENIKKTEYQISNRPQDFLRVDTVIRIEFEYSNNDPKMFGYKGLESALPIGPSNVYLHDNIIYTVDQYHNNIKRYDIESGVLTASNSLTNSLNLWLQDIFIFENDILVTSELDSLYVFDQNLNLMDRKFLYDGGARLLSVSDTGIQIFNNVDEIIIHLDTKYQKVRTEPLEGSIGSRHGKKVNWTKNSIEIPYGIIETAQLFRNGESTYWDYQGNTFVTMYVDSTLLQFNVLKMDLQKKIN